MYLSTKYSCPALEVAESLPAGSGEDWLCWRSLNRLRTGVGHAKTVMGLSRRRPVSDRAGKGMCPQMGEHCVKDTTEEEDHKTVPVSSYQLTCFMIKGNHYRKLYKLKNHHKLKSTHVRNLTIGPGQAVAEEYFCCILL